MRGMSKSLRLWRSNCCFAAIAFLPVSAALIWAQDDKWVELNQFENRSEGLIREGVSQPVLTLLSFTAYREPVTGSADLRVRFFAAEDSRAQVQARELEEDRFYWMESKPLEASAGVWNEFGPWSTEDVIEREGLSFSDLGVIVHFEPGKEEVHQLGPALVYHSQEPKSVGRYIMMLRPHFPLRDVKFTLHSTQEDGQETEVFTKKLAGTRRPGIPFPLELDVAELPASPMRLVVTGKIKGQTVHHQEDFKFFHQPRLDLDATE